MKQKVKKMFWLSPTAIKKVDRIVKKAKRFDKRFSGSQHIENLINKDIQL